MKYSIEYLELFGSDRYENPCEEAMKAVEAWVQKRFGESVTVLKGFRKYKNATEGWLIYDWKTGKVYLATIFCQQRIALVKVKEHKPSRTALKMLTGVITWESTGQLAK